MKVIDFFAGVGGFSLAFEKAGFELAGYCEIDKFAVNSFRAIHNLKEGDVWYARDIKEVKPEEIPLSDVWTAGFPCQDISVSGRGRGLKGERSSLFFEIIRLVKGKNPEDRPDWLIFENVKNLFSINRGWDFTAVLITLAEIGYDIEYGLLNSKFFGVPQNRERIFIIARRHIGGRCFRKVFPIKGTDGKNLIQLIGGSQGNRVYDSGGISTTITSQGGGGGAKTGLYFISFIDLNKNSKLTATARCIKARYLASPTNRSSDNSGVLCCCYCCCIKSVLTPERPNKRQNGRRIKGCNEPMFTLTTQDRHGIIICNCEKCEGLLGIGGVLCCGRIRRLTPRETWRLQAIDDVYFDKASAVCSEAQLYKQAGNGVTISVVYAIATKIMEVIISG